MTQPKKPTNYMLPRLKAEYAFVAVKTQIIRGSQVVARAVSANFARRIANALNRYTPGEKGF